MKFAMMDLTGGQLNALVKKVGGFDGAMRLLRGETRVVRTFKPEEFVKVGKYQNRDVLVEVLRVAEVFLDRNMEPLFLKNPDMFPIASAERKIGFVIVSREYLECEPSSSRAKIYARAKECGLSLISVEAGLLLAPRLTRKTKHGKWVNFGMAPVTHEEKNHICSVTPLGGGSSRVMFYPCDEPNTREWGDFWIFATNE